MKNNKFKNKKFKNYGDRHDRESQPGQGFAKKKSLGQHFLRKKSVIRSMIEKTREACSGATVLEIGCGDGVLTEAILQNTDCKRLVCLEIDQRWADLVKKKVVDDRLEMVNFCALLADWPEILGGDKTVVLANLPYCVSFPIMFKISENINLFSEGVVMVQEEVAQKIVAKTGRSFGSASLALQHKMDFKLMDKIGPGAFSPPPKVDSRLVHFKPVDQRVEIDKELDFWRFVKLCFSSPRRMLKNNLKGFDYDIGLVEDKIGGLRAQQMQFEQFVDLWKDLLGG